MLYLPVKGYPGEIRKPDFGYYRIAMNQYEKDKFKELKRWQRQMLRKPSLLNKLSKTIQSRINKWIPEKVHLAITAALKQMIRCC
jgi:hypothetical protein